MWKLKIFGHAHTYFIIVFGLFLFFFSLANGVITEIMSPWSSILLLLFVAPLMWSDVSNCCWHASLQPSPDISVFFSILFAASLSLWPDFAGLDHYSCRSLSPREQFIPPLQKDMFFFPPPLPPKPTLMPGWNSVSECAMGEFEVLL